MEVDGAKYAETKLSHNQAWKRAVGVVARTSRIEGVVDRAGVKERTSTACKNDAIVPQLHPRSLPLLNCQ